MRVLDWTLVWITILSVRAIAIPTPDLSKPKALIKDVITVQDTKKLLYPAIVDAKVNSTVTADLDGHVKRVMKTLGSRVRAGEIILYIVNKDPAFTYSAVAVRSPVSGVLSQINFQLMSKVSKGDKLFMVLDAESLKINVEIPSSEVGDLRAGTIGEFRLNQQERPPLTVKVTGISPVIDPRSGTASAEVEFVNPGKSLPPVGSVGQVLFQISTGKVVLLPETSLSYVEGKPTVRVIDENNKSHRRFVELGEQREDQFVIKTGLKDGEKVVVRSSRSLKEDEEVEVQTGKAQN